MANTLNQIGIIYRKEGDYYNALTYYNRGLQINKEIGNEHGMSMCLGNISSVYKEQGDYTKAIKVLVQSFELDKKLNKRKHIAIAHDKIADLHRLLGNYDEAFEHISDELKILEDIGDVEGVAEAYNSMGNIYSAQNAHEKALEFYYKAYKMNVDMENRHGVAIVLGNMGVIHLNQESYDEANVYMNRALKLFEEMRLRPGMTLCYLNLGMIAFEQGDFAKSISNNQRSLEMATELGDLSSVKKSAETLYKAYKATNQPELAIEMGELAKLIDDSIDATEAQRKILQNEYKMAMQEDSIKNAEAEKVLAAEITAQKAELKREHTMRIALYGGLFLVMLFGGYMVNRFRVSQKQKKLIQSQKEIVEEQKEKVEEAHLEITDSIAYAKRIQSAILPPSKLIKEHLKESFVLYKPKDVVAGDFYWLEEREGYVLFAAADCTGHGVPGAMVSVICNNGLNRSVREHGLKEPGKILDKTREIVIQEFEKSEEEVKDGMDIALCSLKGNKLQYAGAHNPLWIIRNGEVLETKADKQPIGKYDDLKSYTTHSIDMQKGDSLYIFSDGYVDQFGGPKGKKFRAKQLRELLLSIQDKSMEEQKVSIDKAFEDWRGSEAQVDDVCMIGVRI